VSAKCPKCGERTSVTLLQEIVGDASMMVRVSHLVPPPYCPICGHPWWREKLAEEAERVMGGRDDELP